MPKKEISLLPERGKPINKFFEWVLSVGRYIVVFTELIVIGAFLSRFWLDRRNSDLSEKIRQQRAILVSSHAFEKEFRSFQERLAVVNKNLSANFDPLMPLVVISESLPPDILLSNYQYNKTEDTIKASLKTQVYSEAGLSEFINALVNQPEVISVQVGTIEKEEGKSGMSMKFLVNFQVGVEENAQKKRS